MNTASGFFGMGPIRAAARSSRTHTMPLVEHRARPTSAVAALSDEHRSHMRVFIERNRRELVLMSWEQREEALKAELRRVLPRKVFEIKPEEWVTAA